MSGDAVNSDTGNGENIITESKTPTDRQPQLMKQDLSQLKPETLTALTPEVISRQATINVGTIGHVAHGKSTVVKAISGVTTVRFRNELERNITIKLGYANAKIYKGDLPPGAADDTNEVKDISSEDLSKKEETENKDISDKEEDGKEEEEEVPLESEGQDDDDEGETTREVQKGGFYTSRGSSHPDVFTDEATGVQYRLRRHVSFVDCPGHDILMATMLNGAAVMDAALLLVAGNETCPQPQTSEHLAAVEIMRLENIIILQNKVDLVKPDAAQAQHEQIRKFVAGTVADSAPIIPISAVLKYNVDVVCEYLVHKIPIPLRDFTSPPRLIVIRSFDVNKPGQDVSDLQGGVAGGSILQGVLRVGDEIEVRPGIVTRSEVSTSSEADQDGAGGSGSSPSAGSIRCSPIFSRISSLYAEHNDLQFAVPGGLIGVGTRIDPTLTRADRLVGQVLGLKGKLPDVYSDIEISYYLLRRLLGVKTADGGKQAKVQKLSRNEILMVNIGSTATGGRVQAVKGDLAKILLTQPVCTQEGEKIALSRRVDKHWRLIGWGQIRKGNKIEVVSS